MKLKAILLTAATMAAGSASLAWTGECMQAAAKHMPEFEMFGVFWRLTTVMLAWGAAVVVAGRMTAAWEAKNE